MGIVILTAFLVGGATMVGCVIGFLFHRVSCRFQDTVISFAAGVMLSAAVIGLILPSIALGGKWGIVHAAAGILAGSILLSVLDRTIHKMKPVISDLSIQDSAVEKVILFTAAIAIHNFPEGLAAGVSFGTGSVAEALLIAGGIAVQNIPEGMVTVTPMIAAGIDPKKSLLCGILTGVSEIVGTLLGYWAVTMVSAVLPFLLAFAGGTMLYVICDEMIPETHGHGNSQAVTHAFLIGFTLMMISDILLG